MASHYRQRMLAASVMTAATFGLLAGCALLPVGPTPSASPTAGTATPTATSTAQAPDSDVVFTITATTTATDGSTVQLEMVGHATHEWDEPGHEAVKDSFIAQCTALGGGTVSQYGDTLDETSLDAYGSSMMVIDITSSPSNATVAAPISLKLGSPYYFRVASGTGLANTDGSACYGGYQLVSTGTASAIVNYETGTPDADLSQWRIGRYGFAPEFGSTAVISNCVIELSDLAIASDVADVHGWDPNAPRGGECTIGYQGE